MGNRPWENDPLEYFRRLVSFLYREIGAMWPQCHPEIARKRNMGDGFYSARKDRARRLYIATQTSTEPSAIVAPYVAETGLTLGDVERAFREGDWRYSTGRIVYGGPRWAEIAQATLALGEAIDAGDTETQTKLLKRIDTLRHNSDRIVGKFPQLD